MYTGQYHSLTLFKPLTADFSKMDLDCFELGSVYYQFQGFQGKHVNIIRQTASSIQPGQTVRMYRPTLFSADGKTAVFATITQSVNICSC